MVNPDPAFWNGKRVLLTGHTGFKGAWAATWLNRMGAVVHGAGLAPTTVPSLWESLGRPQADDGFVDIRDAMAVAGLFERLQPQIVLHFAAQALVRASYDDPVTTFSTNVMGLVNIFEAIRRTPSVHAVVNVTSDKCYENREQLWAYRENEAMGGADPYSASKGCAELVTTAYRRSFFVKPGGAVLASARAGNVIGGGDWSDDRLVPDALRAFASNTALNIRNPRATRPWQHVLEPVCGYLVLAEALVNTGQDVAEGWNFGPADDDAWPVEAIVNHLVRAWGGDARWERDERTHPHEAMLLRVDAAKARARLGWRPRLGIGTALDWTVDWAKKFADGAPAVDLIHTQIQAFEALDAFRPEFR